MDKLLTTKELATIMNVSPGTIRNMMKKGLPYIQINKVVRFDWNRVKDWLEKETTKRRSEDGECE